MNLVIISICLGFCLTALGYIMFSRKDTTREFYLSKSVNLDDKVKSTMTFMGGDILAFVPDSILENKRKDEKLKLLLTTSGNPWNVTMIEFFLLQLLMAFVGFILGIAFFIFRFEDFGLMMCTVILFVAVTFGYMYPRIYYNSASKARETEFRIKLPEAIDYLVMALSGSGSSLPMAFEKTILYMEDNVIKEEFTNVISALNSGKSMVQALDEFAERAPTEGIKAFVRSLNNANNLSVPVTEILTQMSSSSRKDLFTLIEQKLIILPVKIMAVIMPMAFISILLIALAPMITVLIGSF